MKYSQKNFADVLQIVEMSQMFLNNFITSEILMKSFDLLIDVLECKCFTNFCSR